MNERTHNLRGLLGVAYSYAPGRRTLSRLDELRVDAYYARITAELERPEWID